MKLAVDANVQEYNSALLPKDGITELVSVSVLTNKLVPLARSGTHQFVNANASRDSVHGLSNGTLTLVHAHVLILRLLVLLARHGTLHHADANVNGNSAIGLRYLILTVVVVYVSSSNVLQVRYGMLVVVHVRIVIQVVRYLIVPILIIMIWVDVDVFVVCVLEGIQLSTNLEDKLGKVAEILSLLFLKNSLLMMEGSLPWILILR